MKANFSILILFVPLFPLVGAFWKQTGAMILSGLAWVVLIAGLFFNKGSNLQSIMIALLPALGLLSAAATRLSQREDAAEGTADLTGVARSYEELRTKHQALKKEVIQIEQEEGQSLMIYGAARSLAEALSWRDMAPRLTSSIQKIFGAYEYLLFAFDDQGERTLLHRRGSWSKDYPLETDFPSETVIAPPDESSEVVPMLVVPVFSGEGLDRIRKGVLIMKWPAGNRSEKLLLTAGREFGEQLGMALEKALLFSQMENHSRLDGLTGVLRRHAFMSRLADEFKRARVFHTPFSVMMVDIDHFKAVNDSHGHAAGDEVLRRIGELLTTSIYETDVVGRYGGEEFILLFPKAQADGVLRKAEILRQTIERDIISVGFEKLSVTVSIGVAHYPTDATTSDQLIALADQAMYQAKESGRNRVVSIGH